MKDHKEIMRDKIIALEKENKALRSNDINTILAYVKDQADQLDRVGQYAQEANGCHPVFLDPKTEKRQDLAHGSHGWIIAGIIERLAKENAELDKNMSQAVTDAEVARKQLKAYQEKHPAVKAVK